jgi:hypothetical protein
LETPAAAILTEEKYLLRWKQYLFKDMELLWKNGAQW